MTALTFSPKTPVIITGAASGIGQACARALAEAGRPLALWDLNGEATIQLAADISTCHQLPCLGLAVDIADLSAIERAASQSREQLGAIGGLVHAAGVAGATALEQLDATAWDAVLNINLRALPFIIQGILQDLKAQNGSAVVGIASINATLGNAANPAYSASKGGMNALVRALADDLAQHGIRINTVSPGQIETPMLEASMNAVPGLRERFEQRILLQRLGRPEEVARAVRFLLSDEASYITAEELVVDGGNISSQR